MEQMILRVAFCIILFFIKAWGEDIKADTKEDINQEIKTLDLKLNIDQNIWLKKYANFERHNSILEQLKVLEKTLENLKKNPKSNALKIQQTEIEIDTLSRRLELLGVDRNNPFKDLLLKPEIGEVIDVKNPFAIIWAVGFLKHLDDLKKQLIQKESALDETLDLLERKHELLLMARKHNKTSELEFLLRHTQSQIFELRAAQNVLQTTDEIFDRSAQEARVKVKNQIKAQVIKMAVILAAIIVSIALALLLKMLLRRYLGDSERYYLAAKVINFLHISLVVLIVMFAYLDNVAYLVTFLGFASAGLAIAMKDLFMSLLGWCVITIGGSIRVGDRIKILKDGSEFLGDVLDISALRITLYEDVTLQSMQNGRAGRIIFIPNHYIFTTMVANYTHGGLKSVWDGIEFNLTFDSDIERAKQIGRDIILNHINIDLIRREFVRLRTRYGMKIPDLSIRIFSLMENNGIKLCLWYPTSVHGAMQLKSTISLEITEALLKEPNIHIAYNTTKLVKDGRDGFGNKMAESFPIEM